MTEGTRIARVEPLVALLRQSDGTRIAGMRSLVPRSVKELFRDAQRELAAAVRAEARPGLFVFAAHLRFGHLARLWLEATELPRAGMIGRHDNVDLALPLDDALSLRHLMFIVRREEGQVRFAALDLETPNGMQLETGQPARLVEAEGPLILAASDFLFFCLPSGQPLPWDSEADDAWATLRPRSVCRLEPVAGQSPGAVAGQVEVRGPGIHASRPVDPASLRRGVLVGRSPRCEVRVENDTVSRVHAVLIQLGGRCLVIDAGSRNGTWRGEEEVRLGALVDGQSLVLGSVVTLTWQAAARGGHGRAS